ncbi:MAG: BMP family ABC transporter substrate-binding protein [Oscillospiraceae bacterium]|nr:BMP family ABC transporter substrate-binding protein [Oscillospiraceae bacterium]
MANAEAVQYYAAALKQGQKEYKNCVHRGRYPYIQSLQQIRQAPLSQIALGVMDVPIYLVVGSTQDARCNSFSPGFYPLLGPDTEFATKWTSLCSAQLTEGIHDPIKCYEYLGRFYAEEGNKRVSVLKSLGSATIRADVIRLMPAQSDDITVKIYLEFLDFFRCSKCWGIHFSDLGGYAGLQAALGFEKDQEWPEDFQRKFKRHYFTFRDCFYRLGGAELGLTTGDALLRWLHFHSGADFLSMEAEGYRQTLSAVWKELCVYTEPQPIAVSLAPMGEEKKAAGASALLSFAKRKLRCAFLFLKSPETSAWTAAHDKGRARLEEVLGDSVTAACYYDVDPQAADAVLEEAVDKGADLVFTTSVSFLDAALRVAVKYPKVRFMNCSIDQPYVNVKAYYSRVYEAKFITGAIAGALSKTGRIGYVGSYPILGVPASINAFALGASLTNPEARIDLRWHCLPGDYVEEFRRQGITLVSDRDYIAEQPWGAQGLARVQEDGSLKLLASPSWLWGEFYVRIVRDLLQDPRRVPLAGDSDKAINYWWGMNSGVVDLKLSDDLPEGAQALAHILQHGIQSGAIQPFRRAIRTQDGRTVNDGSRDLTMEEILKMDWLCDRVDGCLPAYEELLPIAQPTVRRLGVNRRLIPPEGAGV